MKRKFLNSREEKEVVGGTDTETKETTSVGGFSSTPTVNPTLVTPVEAEPAMDMVKPKKNHFWNKWFKKKDKKVDETKKIEP